MEHHVDRRVVLSQGSEFKNLYAWSLQEFDADGNKIGRDQIPWGWTLYFVATELTLSDTLSIKPDYRTDDEDKTEINERQFIRAKLLPRDRWDRGGFYNTAYSMFGTGRTISAFELYIEQLEGEGQQERCTAWGCVSYTSEVDFFDETTDDTIIFYLYVNAETFSRYAAKIAASEVNEATLRVSHVDGFYSEWSPAISTRDVKVLTSYKEQVVEVPDGCEIIPPRLGSVGEAEFYLRSTRKLETVKDETAHEDSGGVDEDLRSDGQINAETDRQVTQQAAIANARAVSLLASLRVAAWVIAALLVLILIT